MYARADAGDSEYKHFMRKYWDVQTQTFEQNAQVTLALEP
jgi:hypothetical protein